MAITKHGSSSFDFTPLPRPAVKPKGCTVLCQPTAILQRKIHGCHWHAGASHINHRIRLLHLISWLRFCSGIVFFPACLSALLSSWTSVLCSGGCKQHDSKVYVESQHRVKPRGPNLSMSQHVGPVSAGSPMKHFSTGTSFTMLQPVFTSWSSTTVPSCGGCKQHDSKV